jgi:nicotinate phosphoribosyltransferase
VPGFLYTDHYQLVMAQLYFRAGLHEHTVRFDHTFRSYPDYGTHQAGYAIAAGLGPLLEWMEQTRCRPEDIEVLRNQHNDRGDRLFGDDFLEWLLANGNFEPVQMWAVPEGRVVHPQAVMTAVEGPLAIAQILETSLLNQLNFSTLIATKASRVAEAGDGGTVLEFGLRRAQGYGSLQASRAALIGGAAFTSHVEASAAAGIPSKGTHAHSMVQVFMALGGTELDAFREYARVYPDACLLLVDTIDTLESGVPNAITVFEELRRAGHQPLGIRLDSGDLAHLAVRSAALLDAAGFEGVGIVISSRLDELTIWQIRNQILVEAPRYGVDPSKVLSRLSYGVGSALATSAGDPALDGVYKLVAISEGGEWRPAIKISNTLSKIANPGVKQVWRIMDDRGKATADVVALADETLSERPLLLHHATTADVSRHLTAEHISEMEPLLIPVGEMMLGSSHEQLEEARKRRQADLERLDPGVRRLVNPHLYHVSLSDRLYRLKQELVERYST